jgi:hypothetical protein
VYPEPHFPAAEDERCRHEIREQGFVPDPWLSRLDTPVLGFNLAFHWPLPSEMRAEYERLSEALAALDPAVYVYPYPETHVTVATLVSFKRHERPGAAEARRLFSLVSEVFGTLADLTAHVPSLEIDVGAPVLVRSAAFLPILDASGNVARLRHALLTALGAGENELALAQAPPRVHSTVLRFRAEPTDPEGLMARFREIARSAHLGAATVGELLVTSETLPYMLGGEVLLRLPLVNK